MASGYLFYYMGTSDTTTIPPKHPPANELQRQEARIPLEVGSSARGRAEGHRPQQKPGNAPPRTWVQLGGKRSMSPVFLSRHRNRHTVTICSAPGVAGKRTLIRENDGVLFAGQHDRCEEMFE